MLSNDCGTETSHKARMRRVKTGCRTCRIRRVKCDETRPSCQRCTSTQRVCDGYELFPAPAREAARRNPRNLRPKSDAEFGFLLPAPSCSSLSTTEWQNFNFFRCQTVREIPGCFSSSLWDEIILQLSHREPSILHAAVAVGGMHRSRTIGVLSTVKPPTMVLMQYTKALGYLRALLAESNDRQRCAETALVACLLFMCLEMLQCNQLGAVAHLRTGLRILAGVSNQDVILNERNAGDSRVTPSVGLNPTLDQHLSPVFTRLDYEAIVFGERGPLLSLRSSQGSSGAFCIPRAFASLSEARHYLDILASAVLRFRGELLDLATLFLKDNEELDSARRHCLQYAYTRLIDFSQHPGLARRLEDLTTNLIQWSTAFKQLTNIQQSRAHFQLEIQHFYYFFLISTSQDAQELNCDRFNPSFARSLSLARKFTANPTNPQSTFTLESAIIPCLYLISLKCRDPGMRREAIDLLSRTPTQEGMWQGALFAKFIRHVVDLEEGPGNPGTTSSDIPEAARFSEIVLAVTEQQARIISAKVQDGEVHIGESIWPFLTYRHTILS